MGLILSYFQKIPDNRVANLLRWINYALKSKRYYSVRYHIRKNIWIVTHDGISLFFCKNPYHTYVMNDLFVRHFPGWIPEIIVDAGAYHGGFGIFLGKKYPEAKVIFLEPDPDSYKVLLKNIELNDLQNVQVLKKGLWNTEGITQFNNGRGMGSAILRNNSFSEAKEAISIETTSPEQLLPGCEKKRVFFKMNIEGAELEALPAALSLWRRNNLAFSIETNHLVNGELTYKAIEELCRLNKIGYQTEKTGDIIVTYIGPQKN